MTLLREHIEALRRLLANDEIRAAWAVVTAQTGPAGHAMVVTQIAASIRRLAGLGASNVIQPTEDEPDLLGFLAFLGREVRPLLTPDTDR